MSPKSGCGQECSCVAYRYPTDTPTDTQPAHIEAGGPAALQPVHLDWQPRKYVHVHMNECEYVRLFVCVCRHMHVYIYIYIYICIYAHTYHLVRICPVCICGPQILVGGRKSTHRLRYRIMAPERGFDDDSSETRRQQSQLSAAQSSAFPASLA